ISPIQPANIIDDTIKELYDFPARVNVIHRRIQNEINHHLEMIMATSEFLIQLSETIKIQTLNQSVNHVTGSFFYNILIYSLKK
ncbi:hypothetical protein EVA_21405, partial [gut metagenome]